MEFFKIVVFKRGIKVGKFLISTPIYKCMKIILDNNRNIIERRYFVSLHFLFKQIDFLERKFSDFL